ncbi:unnamed protein product, partial [Polarella glacialis]
VKPCCTESDNFRRFHELFYGLYDVKGCAVWRQDKLPVSWHGNGAGKWLYLLALDRLSMRCPVVANLTLALSPTDMIGGVFRRFEERSRIEGLKWPGGFLITDPVRMHEDQAKDLPAECAS